jgi:hypothetical protein
MAMTNTKESLKVTYDMAKEPTTGQKVTDMKAIG